MKAEPVVVTVTFTYLFLMSSVAPFQHRYCSEQKNNIKECQRLKNSAERKKIRLKKSGVYYLSLHSPPFNNGKPQTKIEVAALVSPQQPPR